MTRGLCRVNELERKASVRPSVLVLVLVVVAGMGWDGMDKPTSDKHNSGEKSCIKRSSEKVSDAFLGILFWRLIGSSWVMV